MSEAPFDSDAFVEAMAGLLALPIADEHRPGIRMHLEVAARMAALVMDFSLGDQAEPAPVFVA